MRAISNIQQGVIAQFEFANILTLGTNGRLEVAVPLADDERRDYEIHIKGDFLRSLAVQVKSARHLINVNGHKYLGIRFIVANARIVKDLRFWYFFAHLDFRKMAFTEPVYLVPSTVVHSHARPISGNRSEFLLLANLSRRSKDKWATYQLSIAEVGPTILRVIEAFPSALQGSASVSTLSAMPGLVLVSQLPNSRVA